MIINSIPLVSVIVTTFKRPDYLDKTLKSILSQTYNHLQIIVIDDSSNDNTKDVVQSFADKRIQFLTMNKHAGRPAIPRNFGMSYANGEFIAFCDDDDIWDAQKITTQLKVFTTNPKIKLCYTDCITIDKNDRVIDLPFNNKINNQKVTTTFEKQLLNNNIAFSTVMIHKGVLSNGLKFDERPILRATEDYLFFTNIVHSYPIHMINEPLVKYRIHHNGISYCRNSTTKLAAYYVRILICMHDFYKSKKIHLSKFIFLIHFHFWLVIKQIISPYIEKWRE